MTTRYSEKLGMNIRIFADRTETETGAVFFKKDYEKIEKMDNKTKKTVNNIMSVFNGELL